MAEAIEHREITVTDEEIEEILATEAQFRRECRRREREWISSCSALPATGLLSRNKYAYRWSFGNMPVLSYDEIVDLSRRYHAGENAYERIEAGEAKPGEEERLERLMAMGNLAKWHMVMTNLPLVAMLEKRFQHGHIDYPDICQAGYSGLIRAVELYDYTSGYAFSTYATFWIKAGFQEADRKEVEERTVCLPSATYQDFKKILGTLSEGEDFNEPSDKDLAKRSGLEEKRIAKVRRAAHTVTSLDQDAPIDDEEPGKPTIGEIIPDESPDSRVPETVVLRELSEQLNELVAELDEDDQYLVKHRYGLGGEAVLKRDDMARHFGITARTVSTRLRKAMAKLKENPKTPKLQAYLTDFA